MPTKHLETAVFLLKVAPNPLILDAIRVLSTPKYDPKITAEAKKYVEKCYDAALILFTGCDKYSEHDLDPTRFDASAAPGGD